MAGAAGGWEVYLSGSSLGGFDEALAVAVYSAGDVVASGYTHEVSGMALDVAKLSGADGTVRWQYRLPGEESKPQAVAVDPSGDVIAVGSIDGPGSRDFVVIRLAGASGQELWRTVLYGTSTDPDGHWSLGFAVALDQSGDIVSAGSTNNAQTDEDFTVVKLGSADGHEVWRTVIDGTEHGLDRAFAITTDPAGDIVAVGDTTNAAFGEDILVVKLTGTDGREVWRRVIGPSPEARVVSHASSVAINPTGDVLVAGSVSDVEVHQTFTVLKLAGADGVELWRAEMGEGQAGVALDDDGNVHRVRHGWRAVCGDEAFGDRRVRAVDENGGTR